jgi:hypothetical protein
MLLPAAATPVSTQAQSGERCFAETGFCVSGRLLQYWEQNGGLPVFGLPITPQREETIGDWTGQVQWFERNRLELHPENAPPYDVLLGRLGAEFVASSGGPPPRQEPRDGCTYFDETGYNVCGAFLAYWSASGLDLGEPGISPAESLALFGLPLTGEFEATLADGTTHVVQWFERARFELHPENAPPYNVLLTRLGADVVGEPQGSSATSMLTIEFVGNRSGSPEQNLVVTIVDAAGVERTATSGNDGRVTFANLPGDSVQLTSVVRDGQAFTLRLLPSQDVSRLILPLSVSGERTIRLLVSIYPFFVLADPDDGIRAPEAAQPTDPAAEDPAAVETAIRAYLGPEIGNDPPTSYSVERICIDQGFAAARVTPDLRERYEPFGVLLELQTGQWTVILDGRSGVILDFLSAERRAELGIPADFACLQPPQ